MLPTEALRDMRVMIATPCHGANVTAPYAESLFLLAGKGLNLTLKLHSESLLTRSRNRLVAIFLSDPTLTHLFFIDADIGFLPDAFARLLLSDLDVVCGAYPLKDNYWPADGVPHGTTQKDFAERYARYVVTPLPEGKIRVSPTGFAEVLEAGTGFMCIKRGVFDQLKGAYPDMQYSQNTPGEAPDSHWLFFDTMVDQETKRYLSEDYAFCRRWRDTGGKIHIDAHSRLLHQGQHQWYGDFAATLEAIRRG